MGDFKSSLIREKFIISDDDGAETERSHVLIAVSNRMSLDLNSDKAHPETYVVRTQNMHSCIRFSAEILKSYRMGGEMKDRFKKKDWERLWRTVHNDYEKKYNPELWGCVYQNGKNIFQFHNHHAFFDVIEKCNMQHSGAYEMSIPLAEDMIGHTGKPVSIDYDGNVALVVDYGENDGRNGIILRTPKRSATFSFHVEKKSTESHQLNYAQTLSVAAAFLEGIQLSYFVGINLAKMDRNEIKKPSQEYNQTFAAQDRLRRLSIEIANLNASYTVNYRPEQPSFEKIIESLRHP